MIEMYKFNVFKFKTFLFKNKNKLTIAKYVYYSTIL